MRNDGSIQRIVDHYRDAEESSGLRTGWFPLERARTQELLLRHLPATPATVIAAGGGAGAYACWLAARGDHVHLIDPVPKPVEQARAASSRQPQHPLARQRLETRARFAMATQAQTQSCSSVRSIISSRRKTDWPACGKPAVFCAREDSCGYLEDGQHRNSTGNPLYFTDAYLHRPEELSHAFATAGLRVLELLAIEGPGWPAQDFDRLWSDPQPRERFLGGSSRSRERNFGSWREFAHHVHRAKISASRS